MGAQKHGDAVKGKLINPLHHLWSSSGVVSNKTADAWRCRLIDFLVDGLSYIVDASWTTRSRYNAAGRHRLVLTGRPPPARHAWLWTNWKRRADRVEFGVAIRKITTQTNVCSTTETDLAATTIIGPESRVISGPLTGAALLMKRGGDIISPTLRLLWW